MLGLAGLHLHPALRIAIGVALVAAGLVLHAPPVLILVGGALALYGVAGAFGLTDGDGSDEPARRDA